MTALYTLARISIVITPIIIIILLATPFLNRKYTAVGRYYLWIIIMAALISPWFIPGHGLVQINIPQVSTTVFESTAILNSDTGSGNSETGVSVARAQTELLPRVSEEAPLDVRATAIGENYTYTFTIEYQTQSVFTRITRGAYFYNVLLAVWLAGAALLMGFKIISHILLKRHITRWGTPEENPAVLDLFAAKLQILGIDNHIGLIRCKGISSPMLVGNIHPQVLLPHGEYSNGDLDLIFTHELIHYKRHDLWYKLVLLVVQLLYWFNPIVFLMAKQANKDIEDICDMLTVKGLSREAKKCYGSLILDMATNNVVHDHEQRSHTQLSTCMNGGKKEMKQRFNNILGKSKKRGIILFSVAGVIIALAAALIGINFSGVSAEIDLVEYEPDYYVYEYGEEAESEEVEYIPDEYEAEEENPYEIEEETVFVMPYGYAWRGPYTPYAEEMLRVTLRRHNIREIEFASEVPVNYIHINFPASVHIVQSDEDFVRVSTDAYILERLDITLDNGALIIEPHSVNIFSNRELEAFTDIYIGVNQYMGNIVLRGVYGNNAQLPESLTVEENAINLFIWDESIVHIDVEVSSLRLAVTDVYSVMPAGEAELLELSVWGQSKIDISTYGIMEARLHLYNHDGFFMDGEYNIRVFLEVADFVEINGAGNHLVWIMFSEPEVVDNVDGEVNLVFFS